MVASVTAAIIAASASVVVSVVSSICGWYRLDSQSRLTAELSRESHVFEQRLLAQTKAEEEKRTAQALVNRARRPLLNSAIELLSRISNIQHGSFFYYLGVPERKELALQSTLYLLGKYWCLSNKLYNEVDLVSSDDHDLQSEPEIISNQLYKIAGSFSTDRSGSLMMWRLEQQAVGELMLGDDERCIGLDAFIKKYKSELDLGLGSWLKNFAVDLEKLGTSRQEKGCERLTKVGESLSILILQLARHYSRGILNQYTLKTIHSYGKNLNEGDNTTRVIGKVATVTRSSGEHKLNYL